jgi:hypothetical protein
MVRHTGSGQICERLHQLHLGVGPDEFPEDGGMPLADDQQNAVTRLGDGAQIRKDPEVPFIPLAYDAGADITVRRSSYLHRAGGHGE